MRVNGSVVEKVEAFPVHTKWGVMPGGYYPIKYNTKLSSDAAKHETVDYYEDLKRGNVGRATTKKGHTESRVKGDPKHLLRLDPQGVILEHVNQVIHDLAYHEMLIDMNRLMNTERLSSTIQKHYGSEVLTEVRNTIKDVALGDIPATTFGEQVLNHIRIGSSISAMAWNMSTASIQFLGISQSMARVGVKWILKGSTRFFTGAEGMENGYKWILENSEMMRNRAKTINREINEIKNKVQAENILGGIRSDMGDTFFYFIAKAQMMVDVPTWIGAYTKAMEEGVDGRAIKDEAEAIAMADQAVKESQSSGEIMDLAGMQKGPPSWKLWTNFYSFFSSTYNNTAHSYNRTDFKNPRSVGLFAADMILIYTLPVALSLLLKDIIIRGECNNGEDLECVGKKLVIDHVTFLLSTVMFAREVGGAIQGFNGYDGPAGSRFFSAISALIVQINQGELDRAAVKTAIQTMSTAFHLPGVFVTRIVDAYMDAQEGKNVRPLAPLFGQARDSK